MKMPHSHAAIVFSISLLTLAGCSDSRSPDPLFDYLRHGEHGELCPGFMKLFPTVERLPSGLQRVTYTDNDPAYNPVPLFIVYFSERGVPVNPFSRLRIGMEQKEVYEIVGEPFSYHEGRTTAEGCYLSPYVDRLVFSKDGKLVAIDPKD